MICGGGSVDANASGRPKHALKPNKSGIKDEGLRKFSGVDVGAQKLIANARDLDISLIDFLKHLVPIYIGRAV